MMKKSNQPTNNKQYQKAYLEKISMDILFLVLIFKNCLSGFDSFQFTH